MHDNAFMMIMCIHDDDDDVHDVRDVHDDDNSMPKLFFWGNWGMLMQVMKVDNIYSSYL
jgi:hypothetical protein